MSKNKLFKIFFVYLVCLILLSWYPQNKQKIYTCPESSNSTMSLKTEGSNLLPLGKYPFWGYIDSTGKMVIKPQFDNAEGFYEDRAAVKIKDKWGFIDTNGNNFIAKPQYKAVASLWA